MGEVESSVVKIGYMPSLKFKEAMSAVFYITPDKIDTFLIDGFTFCFTFNINSSITCFFFKL